MHIVFVEPPKDFWFIMGEYVPPPFGILCLAAYIELSLPDINVTVVDCQAMGLDWDGLEKKLEELEPNIIAPSGLATANAFYAIRTAELGKTLNPDIVTVLGGTHFSALANSTLKDYPFIDYIVRGEGEKTLTELIKTLTTCGDPFNIQGLSFRRAESIIHNQDRPLICNLDTLPKPAYHHVFDYMKEYYFSLMADKNKPFAIIEGSRGCRHNCTYCSQWRFWRSHHRTKSPQRVVDEFQRLHDDYESRFFWFTDDNFGLGPRTRSICEGIIERGLDIEWFCQVRVDDIVSNENTIELMRKAGATWMLVGFDNPSPTILDSYRRSGVTRPDSKKAVELLRKHEIFSQGTFIVGHRNDSYESIKALREYSDYLDPDIATFFALTPFPGTEIYEEASRNGWIEDENWANYDMIHAIMPTEHLTREEVQDEIYGCYESFFGSWPRRYRGLGSNNPITKRTYLYLAKQAILMGLKNLVR